MEATQILVLLLVIALVIWGIKWYTSQLDGTSHYMRYPGARLIDDAAKQRKLPAGGVEVLVQRVGAVEDCEVEVRRCRAEFGIAEGHETAFGVGSWKT